MRTLGLSSLNGFNALRYGTPSFANGIVEAVTSTSWVVPAGITVVRIWCLGAAGGSSSASAKGGDGGYVRADFAVTPGETLLLRPGGGGKKNGTGGTNGGGAGGVATSTKNGGGGGGYSGVFRTSVSQANALIIAGGGSGTGKANVGVERPGSLGGGSTYLASLSGQDGAFNQVLDPALYGKGGTVDSGGFQGRGGTSGSALQGGEGAIGTSGEYFVAQGGGGGGYFGGGGGGRYMFTTGTWYTGGAGGGGGYVSGDATNMQIEAPLIMVAGGEATYGSGHYNANGDDGFIRVEY